MEDTNVQCFGKNTVAATDGRKIPFVASSVLIGLHNIFRFENVAVKYQ